MPTAKRVLQSVLPPLLWDAGKDLKRRWSRSVDQFEYVPSGWTLPPGAEAAESAKYWQTFLEHERRFVEDLKARVLAGDPILTPGRHDDPKHIYYAYVLALACRKQQPLAVLDYGGHLGADYWLGRAFVPGVELHYCCRELASIAAVIREVYRHKKGLMLDSIRANFPDEVTFTDPQGGLFTWLTFPEAFDTEVFMREVNDAVTWATDDTCFADSYDLVLFAGSLQYVRDWRDVVDRAVAATRRYLFLSDVFTVRTANSFVARQRAGGRTTLLHQFNRDEIVGAIEAGGLRLVREFSTGECPHVLDAPEQPDYCAWLFERPR